MDRKLKNGKLVIMLLIFSFLLWSKIFLKIREELSTKEKIREEIVSVPRILTNDLDQENINSIFLDSLEAISDPFLYHFKTLKNANRSIDTIPGKSIENIKLPSFKYSGFLADKYGKMALIEISPDEIQFVREGQIFGGFKLIKILSDHMIVKNKGKEFSIPINF
jgi:hypothetical protein